MSDAVQQAFMRALLDMPGVTQRSVATRIGVNRCMVTRWLSGERNLRLGDAMYLVERWGSRPLVEAARVVGLTLRVDEDDDVDGIEGDTAEVRITFLAGLAAETSRTGRRHGFHTGHARWSGGADPAGPGHRGPVPKGAAPLASCGLRPPRGDLQ